MVGAAPRNDIVATGGGDCRVRRSTCDSGRVLRLPRALAVVLLVLTVSLAAAGCSSGATPATTTVAAVATSVATANTDNDFIPTDQNLTSCVGTLELPNCGSEKKSDARLYATFAVLMAGMGLIGWRISVGVRRRERDRPLPEHTF
jgi:hypothetical protein